MRKIRHSLGCRIETTVRQRPDGGYDEEIILQAEFDAPVAAVELDLVEEDTGQWLIAGI